MLLDFIPRAQLVNRLKAGWRLIPGHEYSPEDYAILMQLPEAPEPISIYETMKAFRRPPARVACEPVTTPQDVAVRICRAEGCGRKHYGQGLCAKHWNDNRRVKRATRGWAFVDRKLQEAGF